MIGISVYPYKEDLAKTIEYVETAGKLGVGRIFTNILSVPNLENEIARFKQVIAKAREYNMEVVIDIAPAVFSELGIKPDSLDFFQELGATAVRLDSGYDGFHEAMLTFEKSNMKVELNISYDNPYLETVLAYKPRHGAIWGCHNFYPQRYTGLALAHFEKCSKQVKQLGIRTAAFISSSNATHGPHPYNDRLCTLEMHRDLDLITQAKHLLALEYIDDIIVADVYASENELMKLVKLNKDVIEFNVIFEPGVSEQEKSVILNELHFCRGDINDFVSRSTFVKLKLKTATIPANNTAATLYRGDVSIGNDSFGQYKGEVNIVKQTIQNQQQLKNKVATIISEELFLIDYIQPWTKFTFKEA
ncbi:DUF871 domain-containing protein [Culicoidibacter larvae]|uniref:DUF871 domain-containing protein n=1 Tax=Culicoidibacter larvae TaxID=2579976 RepID=A0A5R8QDX1_9FIRM|nr:MupG family TIM beta-alpha barrel fold protein [Culicoidibacter larvae]TLG75394.1 DUF871 domain-containing protein [Culicoidibacter larvae]